MNDNNTLIFKALSDENRLRILKALQSRVLCACEIKALLKLANSTVSQHLSVLREAGFVLEEKDGRWVNYMINPRPADPRISSILTTLDFWINDPKTIDEDSSTVRTLDRNILCRT